MNYNIKILNKDYELKRDFLFQIKDNMGLFLDMLDGNIGYWFRKKGYQMNKND